MDNHAAHVPSTNAQAAVTWSHGLLKGSALASSANECCLTDARKMVLSGANPATDIVVLVVGVNWSVFFAENHIALWTKLTSFPGPNKAIHAFNLGFPKLIDDISKSYL